MSFLMTKRTLGLKKESTPYTAETLTSDDYNIPAREISYDPEIANYARKLARNEFSRDESIMGKRSITINFSVDIAWSGTADTPPTYFEALECCGLGQTVHSGTGVSLVSDSEHSNVPATIEVVEIGEGASPTQVVIKARGCMGNPEFVLDEVGQPVKVNFEFTGVLDDISDRAGGSLITPTGFDSPLPEAVLCGTIEYFSETQKLNTMTLNLNNTIELFTDPAKCEGWEGAHVTDRNPSLEIDPDLDTIANRGHFSRWTGESTGSFSLQIGDHMTLSAPAGQIVKAYSPGDREGHVVNQLSIELKRSSGDDEFKLLQGSES